ncbi:hypothetical protein IAU60_006340 [Kwoniella sp. DSM 27419]
MLRTKWTRGDGSCMFAAFAKALRGDELSATEARVAALDWARANPDALAAFVKGDYEAYLTRMSNPAEYGDHVMLEALCRAYTVAVSVVKKAEDGSLFWTRLGTAVTVTWSIPLYLENEHYENLVTYDELLYRIQHEVAS